MTQSARLKRTPEEYLTFELASPEKHELIHGELFAMAGSTPEHSLIAAHLLRHLGNALQGTPCFAYTGDLRIQVEATGLYTYPDVSVVCGPRQMGPGHSLLNPTLLVEVLSPSTERWDRGGKFAHYRRLPSLREYLLVSQEAYRVEQFVREGEQWRLRIYEGLEAILELSISPAGAPVHIPVASLYDGVTLAEAEPPPADSRSSFGLDTPPRTAD